MFHLQVSHLSNDCDRANQNRDLFVNDIPPIGTYIRFMEQRMLNIAGTLQHEFTLLYTERANKASDEAYMQGYH